MNTIFFFFFFFFFRFGFLMLSSLGHPKRTVNGIIDEIGAVTFSIIWL